MSARMVGRDGLRRRGGRDRGRDGCAGGCCRCCRSRGGGGRYRGGRDRRCIGVGSRGFPRTCRCRGSRCLDAENSNGNAKEKEPDDAPHCRNCDECSAAVDQPIVQKSLSRTDGDKLCVCGRRPSFLNSLGERHLHDRAARATLYRSARRSEEPRRCTSSAPPNRPVDEIRLSMSILFEKCNIARPCRCSTVAPSRAAQLVRLAPIASSTKS